MKLSQAIDFGKLFSAQGFKNGDLAIGPDLTIGNIVTTILPYIFTISGIALLLFLIFGGISMMLSRGDPKGMQAAKDKVTGAVVGFVILFVSYWLVQIIGKILGITKITDIFQ